MRIRKTTEQDIERVMEIYAYARKFMAEHGNPKQWGATNWPPEQVTRNDIKEGNSFVCVNDSGKVIGTFYYIAGKDIEPCYREILDGKWLDDSPYGVVHRIAADGRYMFLPDDVGHQGIGAGVSLSVPGFIEVGHFWYPCEFTEKDVTVGGAQVYVPIFSARPGKELAELLRSVYMLENDTYHKGIDYE